MKFKTSLAIILGVFCIDQLSKLFFRNILSKGSISLIGDFFRLHLAYNTGAAFSILTGKNVLLIFLSILIISALFYYIKTTKEDRLPISLVIGGALGNLADRIIFGHVIDFIDIGFWPVFNLADTAITIGIVYIIINLIKKKKVIS